MFPLWTKTYLFGSTETASVWTPSTKLTTNTDFLGEYRIKGLVKKYSDYIRYPIKMDVEKKELKEGSKDEYETKIETETLNSMVPIWKKKKSDVTDEEYNSFYTTK